MEVTLKVVMVVAGARLAGENVSPLTYWDLHNITTISWIYHRMTPKGERCPVSSSSAKEISLSKSGLRGCNG